MSKLPGLVSHAQKVCRAYKRALRETRNYYYEPHQFRYKAVLLRAEFDKNKDIKDMRLAKKLLEDLEEELWQRAHPQPIVFPDSPTGVAYQRECIPPDFVLDYWHPIEKAMYPKYFALREKRKKEYEEWYYKMYPDMKKKEVHKPGH